MESVRGSDDFFRAYVITSAISSLACPDGPVGLVGSVNKVPGPLG